MKTSGSVLVVDEDETVLRSSRSVLASANFEVQVAKTGDAALKLLAHQAVDVVLMGCPMPGNDGFAVLRTIKSLWPDMEVVVISGAPSVQHAKEAIRLGACDYLAKPVPPDAVITAAACAAMKKKWALRRISIREPAQPTRQGASS